MARGRKQGSRKKPRQLDPAEVLDGRAFFSARELVELIRRVNPTDRGLPQDETDRRYRQKSALQSLLIRHCPDELEVVFELGETVLLRHRRGGGDACHTLISELDEDARRWVRRKLDEQASEQLLPVPEPAGEDQAPARKEALVAPDLKEDLDHEPRSTAELLQLGRTALKEYDYDRARHLLHLAFSRGAPEAAIAYLELLVDYLGAAEEALALADRLSPGAAGDVRVRVLLGLAAARSRDPELALELIQDLEGPRVAEVHVVLADRAIRAEKDEEAGRHIQRAGSLDPSSHEVYRLHKDLAALRARRWRPVEEEIVQLFAGGELDEAERRARELLERWADSEAARRVLREVGDRRRQEKNAELLARAEEAMGRQELLAAAELYERALRQGADRALVEARLARAKEQARATADSAQVEAVLGLFAVEDRARALTAYLDLPPTLRGGVRERVDLRELRWLEEMGSGVRPPNAVEAVQALDRAYRQEDPRAVLELLWPHERALRGVKQAQKVLTEAEGQLALERQEEARAQLGLAEEAFAAGDLARAGEILVGTGPLTGDLRLLAQDLKQRIQLSRAKRIRTDCFELLLAGGDLLGARLEAEGLAQSCKGEERALWRRRLDEVREQIRRTWRLQVFEIGEQEDLREVDLRGARGLAGDTLLPGGDRVVLASAEGRQVFIQVVCVDTGLVERRAMMKTPEALGAPLALSMADDSMWLLGRTGWMVQLDSQTLEAIRWTSPGAALHPQDQKRSQSLLVNGQYAWITLDKTGAGGGRVTVVNLHSGKVEQILDLQSLIPVVGGQKIIALCQASGRWCCPFHERGVPLSGLKIREEFGVNSATMHLDGEGIVLRYNTTPGVVGSTLLLRTFWPDGRSSEPMAFGKVTGNAHHTLATSREHGLIFVLDSTWESGGELTALRPAASGFERLYDIRTPRDTFLALDREALRVVAVAVSAGGAQVVPLGPSAPKLVTDSQLDDPTRMPCFSMLYDNCRNRVLYGKLTIELAARFRSLTSREAGQLAERLREEHGDDAEHRQHLVQAMSLSGHFPSGPEEPTWRHDPDHPPVVVDWAHVLACEGEWDEVRRLLNSVEAGKLDPGRAQHMHHMLGIALYLQGDIEEARRVWERGVAIEGGACRLGAYMDLAASLLDPRPEDGRAEEPLARQIAAAIIRADAFLQAGDAKAALEAIDQPWVWRFHELQGLARLAESYLLMGETAAVDPWRKTFAIATFCQRHRPDPEFVSLVPHEVPVPGHIWDSARLDGITDRARAWLDDLRER